MIHCNVTVVLTSMTPPNSGTQFYNITGQLVITGQTPSPDPAQPYFKVGPDNTLMVNVPQNIPLRVQYAINSSQLPAGPYIFNGIYFTETPAEDKAGAKGFPMVIIARDTAENPSATLDGYAFSVTPGTMVVVDSNNYNGYYSYDLVIQDVSANTVGIMDPGYDNEH